MKKHYEEVYQWLSANAPPYAYEEAYRYACANYTQKDIFVKRLVRFYLKGGAACATY
jgi:hypothetical protein